MFSFLPIVQRELRVAARRRSISRARWWTSFLAMLLCLVSLAFISAGRTSNPGKQLFEIFTSYAFGLCLLAGVLLTADSLTEEKRDGTLGLLFLTDLKGYDVVLGKFAASSLTAFYCLLALLPITALPFLAGGVTESDFWRTAVALINALFFSLALGLCVSAFARDSHRALGSALGLLLLLVGALPAVVSFTSQSRVIQACQAITWVSPLYAFTYATDVMSGSQANQFWRALGISVLFGCSLLTCASFALPRCWQDRRKGTIGIWNFWYRSKGAAARRKRLREKLLPQHPVAWLAAGELGNQWGGWLVVLAWAAITLFVIIISPDQAETIMLNGAIMTGFAFCLKVLFTLQACRFFAEGRRNGSLELLLCTPLTNRDILGGQVRALWRAFFWPVLVFIIISLSPVAVYLGRAVSREEFSPLGDALGGCFFTGINSVRLIVGLTAACWFGMGLALTLKRPNLAPVLTIISVLILPSILCWLDIVPCLILLAIGLSKCQRDLRRLMMEQYTHGR